MLTCHYCHINIFDKLLCYTKSNIIWVNVKLNNYNYQVTCHWSLVGDLVTSSESNFTSISCFIAKARLEFGRLCWVSSLSLAVGAWVHDSGDVVRGGDGVSVECSNTLWWSVYEESCHVLYEAKVLLPWMKTY